MNRNGHPNLTRRVVDEVDRNHIQIKQHPRDKKLKEFAKIWIHKPIPQALMDDLTSLLADDYYTQSKRVHKIVLEAIKWGLDQ